MGEYLACSGLFPDLVLCSAAQRACETLAFIRDRLERDLPVRIARALFAASAREIATVLEEVEPEVDTVVAIGYNPQLGQLAPWVSRSGDAKSRECTASEFPTAAMAVIDLSGKGRIKLAGTDASLERFIRPGNLADQEPSSFSSSAIRLA